MDFNEKKLALFDAHLSHKGIQHIADTAAELLGNPLFMGDMSLGLVFKSSNMSELDVDYSGEGDVKLQVAQMQKAVKAGYMDWIYAHDAAIVGEIEDQPRYLSARVRDGKLVIGHIVVVERDRQFCEDDELLLPIVCQTVAYELRGMAGASAGNRPYAQLFRSLLDGDEIDAETARVRMAALGYRAPSQLRALVFGAAEGARIASLAFLQAQLDQAFPSSVGIIRDEMCVHLVDGSASLADTLAKIKASTYLGGLRAGVGWPVPTLADLHVSYLQALAAFRLSEDRGAGTVTPYGDVFARHVMELALTSAALPERAFAPPLVATSRTHRRAGRNGLHPQPCRVPRVRRERRQGRAIPQPPQELDVLPDRAHRAADGCRPLKRAGEARRQAGTCGAAAGEP